MGSLQSVWYTRSRWTSSNHIWPRTSTRWPHPHLGTSLSLAPSDQFRTETTSFLTTILCPIVDSTHSSAFYDEPLNSSMMFSSLFTIVQSSVPHCPQCPWLGSSDDFFFCVTASSPIPVTDFFTHSCNPPMYPSKCRALSLGTSSGGALNPSAHSGHELSTSLTYVCTRHLDTGYHRSHCPCDSHLDRHVLAATSLVWPVTLAHHLVHLGNVIRRTRLLHSLRSFVNAEASSNQLLLFADQLVHRTLTVAWKSRHTRVVLLGLASCRALRAAGSAN